MWEIFRECGRSLGSVGALVCLRYFDLLRGFLRALGALVDVEIEKLLFKHRVASSSSGFIKRRLSRDHVSLCIGPGAGFAPPTPMTACLT